MKIVSEDITKNIHQDTESFLMELIRFPSTRGNEGPAIRYYFNEIKPFVDECKLVFVDDSIMDDPDYAFRLPGISYADTPNLECIIYGQDTSQSILFNTHLDVVPPSEDQDNAYTPQNENGTIFGRGACDAKGQAATLFALAKFLKESKLKPRVNLIFQLVFEEENGGNGTLAMVRRGVDAREAIVLEPTELCVIPAVRGAVWFQLRTFGQAGHSGSKGSTRSALKEAIQAMEILENYHDHLLETSRGLPLFDVYEDPMPLTFGECNAGNWPASVPSEATIRGVLGFLPNKIFHQVQTEMFDAIQSEGDDWLRNNFELTFPMLNSDGYSLPEDHRLVKSLVTSVKRNGGTGEIRAMTAACDAWFYNNQAKIPTIVFGPGSLAHAHSKNEQIHVDDIIKAATILMDFVQADEMEEVRDE